MTLLEGMSADDINGWLTGQRDALLVVTAAVRALEGAGGGLDSVVAQAAVSSSGRRA